MEDTTRLENAYARFGNTAYVNHWYGETNLIGVVRPVRDGKIKVISPKPKHWKRALQLTHKRFERLNMKDRWDFILVSRNGRYISIDFHSAKELEIFARKKPHHDWRVEVIGAFETCVYQRQGTNKWFLIELGKGYA